MHGRRLLIALALLLVLPAAARASIVPGWTAVPSMGEPRVGHAAVLLDDGRVLVAGGGPSTSTERFDPVTRTWSRAAPLAVYDDALRLVKLGDGRALAVGAAGRSQLYDPRADSWRRVADLPLVGSFVLAPLSTGKALAAGGGSPVPPWGDTTKAFVFDPASETWSATANPMPRAVSEAQAAPLPNGRVLVHGGTYGGFATGTSGIYNVATNTWSLPAGDGTPRALGALAALGTGRVVAAGGYEDNFGPLTGAEVFDPVRNEWSWTAPTVYEHRAGQAVSLAGGRVMVLGGYGVLTGDTVATEISDSSGTGWTSSGLLSSARRGAAAVALADGRVLVSGGEFGTAFATAELWTPLTSLATFEDLLSFGQPAVGDRTSASVAIVNTGAEPLVVGDLGLGGAHAQDFAVSRDRCGGPILPGTRCWLDVTFTPTAGGERQALLTFAANTAAQTYSLALRATAVAPPQPVVHADADGDGVPDAGDRCPALKGPAPRQGCPTGVVADPSIAYKRVKRGIKVVAYYVQATSGARVTVECSKGCKRTVTKGKGSRRVRIKALNGKRLANGTRITVTVSAPGRLTATVTDRVSRGRRIEGRPRCMPVGC